MSSADQKVERAANGCSFDYDTVNLSSRERKVIYGLNG